MIENKKISVLFFAAFCSHIFCPAQLKRAMEKDGSQELSNRTKVPHLNPDNPDNPFSKFIEKTFPPGALQTIQEDMRLRDRIQPSTPLNISGIRIKLDLKAATCEPSSTHVRSLAVTLYDTNELATITFRARVDQIAQLPLDEDQLISWLTRDLPFETVFFGSSILASPAVYYRLGIDTLPISSHGKLPKNKKSVELAETFLNQMLLDDKTKYLKRTFIPDLAHFARFLNTLPDTTLAESGRVSESCVIINPTYKPHSDICKIFHPDEFYQFLSEDNKTKI